MTKDQNKKDVIPSNHNPSEDWEEELSEELLLSNSEEPPYLALIKAKDQEEIQKCLQLRNKILEELIQHKESPTEFIGLLEDVEEKLKQRGYKIENQSSNAEEMKLLNALRVCRNPLPNYPSPNSEVMRSLRALRVCNDPLIPVGQQKRPPLRRTKGYSSDELKQKRLLVKLEKINEFRKLLEQQRTQSSGKII